MVVVTGPCSLHEEAGALEYARRLRAASDRYGDRLVLVMRTYFEKPRTTVGWKGLLNDPFLNGTYDLAAGLRKVRRILLQVAELGVPTATEVLDPVAPQYTADLVCWAAVGARTTESQTHREMASGLSMPIGFKNSTDGNLDLAINAIVSSKAPHHFLGIDQEGRSCVVETRGNPWCHLILRGGRREPNYDEANVAYARVKMAKQGLRPMIMVDCSHANSGKDYARQAVVFRDVLAQRAAGDAAVFGMMLESNLKEGRQEPAADMSRLCAGLSITDPCLGWQATEELLGEAYAALSRVGRGE